MYYLKEFQSISSKKKRLVISFTSGLLLIFVILLVRPFGIRYSFNDSLFLFLIFKYAAAISVAVLISDWYLRPFLQHCLRSLRNSLTFRSVLFLSTLSLVLSLCLVIFITDPSATVIGFDRNTFYVGIQLLFFVIIPLLGFYEHTKIKTIGEYENAVLFLKSIDKKSSFTIKKNQLLFIQSEDNYAAVHYFDDRGKVKVKLLRNTLTDLHKSLVIFGIIRCHRSYLVNPKNIVSAKGSKKNMKLLLWGKTMEVPVSRMNSDIFTHLRG